jgi:hypothetical protein
LIFSTPADGTDGRSIITAANEGKIYQMVLPPHELYVALQWFNPMYKSFKILPARGYSEPIKKMSWGFKNAPL